MMELEARFRFFAALGERPRYERDGVEMLQTLLRQTPEFRKRGGHQRGLAGHQRARRPDDHR